MKSGYEVWCESCGCLMKKRRGKFGEFYGCTGYPACRNTKTLRDAELEPTLETPNDHGHSSYYEYEGDD